MTILYDVKISNRYMEGENVSVIELQSSLNETLPAFEAGAHVDLHLPNGIIRQYSLCQNPLQTYCYRLGILKDQQSRGGSQYIHEQLQIGSELKISVPKNLFSLVEAEHSILIGGGIGITPLITMAYQLHNTNSSFELHYCGGNRLNSAFVTELENSVLAPYTQFHFKNEGTGHRTYFEKNFSQFNKSSHIYTCGPHPFMNWITDLAQKKQFNAAQIHKEAFQNELDLSGKSFQVFAKKSNKIIMVSASETILEALTREGIQVEKSCEQGICGTCLCDVVGGEPDHRDCYLNEEEKQQNDQILLCCSRSKTPQLILEI